MKYTVRDFVNEWRQNHQDRMNYKLQVREQLPEGQYDNGYIYSSKIQNELFKDKSNIIGLLEIEQNPVLDMNYHFHLWDQDTQTIWLTVDRGLDENSGAKYQEFTYTIEEKGKFIDECITHPHPVQLELFG